MPLKSIINILLPIVLSALLPVLGLYASTEWEILDSMGFYWSWFIGSLMLYLIWHVLWQAWCFTSEYKKWWSALLPAGMIAGLLTIFYFFVFQYIEGFEGYNVFRIILPSVLFLVIQYSLKTQESVAHLQLEKEQLQTESYKAQLKALRSQIDPHFLFNSLNTLRSMVHQRHVHAEKFVMSLADFYRQTLKHHEHPTLQLSEELVVLESYLFLMKSRNEEAVQLHINIEESVHTLRLPTLALQTVLENCFKHNSMTAKKPLHIEIINTQDGYIQVSNNRQPKIGEALSSGFGIDLLKKRYALLDIAHPVIIEETDDQFRIKIKLIA